MEGIGQHSCSEWNELQQQLRASEKTILEERTKALEFKAEAEIAKGLAKGLKEETRRLREDLMTQREEIMSLKQQLRRFEEKTRNAFDGPQAELQVGVVSTKENPHLTWFLTVASERGLCRSRQDKEAPRGCACQLIVK